MKLTPKVKQDFEKWLSVNYHSYSYRKFNDKYDAPFYKLHQSMQYGVYVDYFESKGVIIDIRFVLDYDENVYTEVMYWMAQAIQLNVEVLEVNDIEFDELEQARIAAINKASEILETQL